MSFKSLMMILFCLFWAQACSPVNSPKQDSLKTQPTTAVLISPTTAIKVAVVGEDIFKTITPTPITQLKLQVVNSEGAVNVRSGPGTYYPVVNQIANNKRLEPLGIDRSGNWIQFKDTASPDGVAWIFTAFTNFDRKTDQLPLIVNLPTPPVTPTPPPLRSMGTITVINPDGQVNVRMGPGTNYPSIGKVNNGERLNATGTVENGDWVQIQLSNDNANMSAWIYTSYTDYDSSSRTLPVVEIPQTPEPQE